MKKVTFSVSKGYVGSKKEETYYLADLGIIKEEYETEKDFTDAIGESFQEWILDNVDATWDFEEEKVDEMFLLIGYEKRCYRWIIKQL